MMGLPFVPGEQLSGVDLVDHGTSLSLNPLRFRSDGRDTGDTRPLGVSSRADMQQPETFSPLATRLSHRPVVEARAVPGYESIFNAGLLVHEGTYHLFARGVRDGYQRNPGEGPRFLDYVSDILVFESTDGINYSFRYVLATSGEDGDHSFEDPRVQRVRSSGDVQVVMTYTNLPRRGPASPGASACTGWCSRTAASTWTGRAAGDRAPRASGTRMRSSST